MQCDARHTTPRSPLWLTRLLAAMAAIALSAAVISTPSAFAQDDGEEAAGDDAAPEMTLDRDGERDGDRDGNGDRDRDRGRDEQATTEEGESADDARESDGSAEDVMDDLLRRRQPPPATEPQRAPERREVPESVGVPAATVEIDPGVLGIAPGQKAPELRREGEFLVSRRGRLVRSEDGAHVLFVFEADDKDAPERPMIMMPCRMLESMEEIASDRGGSVEFILSGEVFVYRKHNYLLPTMMKIAVDRGNLEN